MAIFTYTARNKEGGLITETIAFQDEEALRSHLRRSDLFVLDITVRKRSTFGMRRRVRLGDLIIMLRQLRTMIRAGMPLVTGIEALSEQSTNITLTEILAEVSRGVAAGRALNATLSDYPKVFPELLIALVRSGEDGGRLPEALQEASRQFELQLEVRQKLISAMLYPVFTLVATVGTVAAMLLFIVPVFKDIYKELHATLPAPTMLLVSLSDFLVNYLWIFLVFMAGGLLALRQYNRTPDGHLKLDGVKLKIPLFGMLLRKTAAANLTGSLAGLLESGLPLLNALQTASRVCGNRVIEEAVLGVERNVSIGRRLSDELELTQQFPLMVVRMISIAEEVGTLPDVLRQISESYIEEIEYAIRRIVTVVEPVLILTVGAVVGFVLVALYYPIFNLANVFMKSG